jgi:hypothetical protein
VPQTYTGGLYMQMPGGASGIGSRWGSSAGAQNVSPSAPTASVAGFGGAYTAPTRKGAGLIAALTPNDAFGIAHVAGLLALGGLVWWWWTAPA